MTDLGAAFRAMHVPGRPFILANAWDLGSARMLVGLGAPAIATSSAAHAFALGRPDGGTVSRDEALAHGADMAAAVSVPVQGDFENGFGDAPETCHETVRLAHGVGLAGICLEDTALPAKDPYPIGLAVDRMRAAVDAARALPTDFVLTARADGVMLGTYDLDEAIRRLQAFAEVGADCLYAPVLPDIEAVARVCREVPGPVNVLVAGPMTQRTLAEFAAAGVARLSLGSALARATHRLIHEAGEAMFGAGRFDPLTAGLSGAVVDELLERGAATGAPR